MCIIYNMKSLMGRSISSMVMRKLKGGEGVPGCRQYAHLGSVFQKAYLHTCRHENLISHVSIYDHSSFYHLWRYVAIGVCDL
jgi:hypothetical protein